MNAHDHALQEHLRDSVVDLVERCPKHGCVISNGTFDAPCGGCEAEMEDERHLVRVPVVAAWGQVGGETWAAGKRTGQVGWVRVRDNEGCCWLYVGTNGSKLCQEFPGTLGAFIARVNATRSINPTYWVRETGPEAQETTPEAEYDDAN